MNSYIMYIQWGAVECREGDRRHWTTGDGVGASSPSMLGMVMGGRCHRRWPHRRR